jgi:predicted DsbA family dithiol-disulfide isomerase
MGGLIPDWKKFHDQENAVTRPLQMGPVWMHAAQLTAVWIDHSIWMRDPPQSSYPPCIAVKCAETQSVYAGEIMLRLLREAVMLDGLNISRTDVILALAKHPALEKIHFAPAIFKNDLLNLKGMSAFRTDLALVAQKRINRFPSLIIRQENKPSKLVSGFRTYDELLGIIKL